jgi:CO/xanthine dehydrogenase Mo-binding subunit
VAEMPLVPFLPAVAAAIHDATGVWLSEQPFTPERVLRALGEVSVLEAREVEVGV